MSAYASSLIMEFEDYGNDAKRPGFDAVYARMVGPLIQMCEFGSMMLETERSRWIYLINCLLMLKVRASPAYHSTLLEM